MNVCRVPIFWHYRRGELEAVVGDLNFDAEFGRDFCDHLFHFQRIASDDL
jgi:hypothetical protein